jgi:hypothetical protein
LCRDPLHSRTKNRGDYDHHIVVDVEGTKVSIERDEEGDYGASADEEGISDGKVDTELISAFFEVLQKI